MLADAGSVASIVGVVVSLGGLGFAILQLRRLRGETRAAREASEATRRAVGARLAVADLGRMTEQIESLVGAHRVGDWGRALLLYPEIRRGLVRIKNRYPDLRDTDAKNILSGVDRLKYMQHNVERVNQIVPLEKVSEFNSYLARIQTVLDDLESRF